MLTVCTVPVYPCSFPIGVCRCSFSLKWFPAFGTYCHFNSSLYLIKIFYFYFLYSYHTHHPIYIFYISIFCVSSLTLSALFLKPCLSMCSFISSSLGKLNLTVYLFFIILDLSIFFVFHLLIISRFRKPPNLISGISHPVHYQVSEVYWLPVDNYRQGYACDYPPYYRPCYQVSHHEHCFYHPYYQHADYYRAQYL